MTQQIGKVESEVKAEIAQQNGELKTEIAEMNDKLSKVLELLTKQK